MGAGIILSIFENDHIKTFLSTKKVICEVYERSVMSDSGGVNDLCVWSWIGVSVVSDRSGLGEGMSGHGAWIGMGCGEIVCICEKRGKG